MPNITNTVSQSNGSSVSANTQNGGTSSQDSISLGRDAGSGGLSAAPTGAAQQVSGRSPVFNGKRVAPPGTGEKQYLILKLERLAVLRKIHFGKYFRSHHCNLKDFKVYGSASTRDPHSKAWKQILRSGLKNDNVAENFDVQWTTSDGVPFPVRYIKIIPLATHLPNYNFSIWHVGLEGVTETQLVNRVAKEFSEHRDSIVLRLMLKHLRSRAYHSAFRVLLESSQLGAPLDSSLQHSDQERPFEHPIVTQLFHTLMQGQWDAAEASLEKAAWGESTNEDVVDTKDAGMSASITAASSLLSAYVERSIPKPFWTPLGGVDENGEAPCGRGGHQMDLDVEKGVLWLFGGWDGSRDLADLWVYYIREARWRCVSQDVTKQGGPSARSCHKMLFDPRTGFLYVLGKFVDHDKASRRGASSPRPATEDSSGTPSSTARGLFLPRFPGATLTDPAAQETQEEMFASNRGGSMRLSGGHRAEGEAHGDTASLHHANGEHLSAPVGSPPGFESDFYRFSTRSERWDRLSHDTFAEGGPKLLFDHQMVIDPETQLLYVFGGRVATADSGKVELSGMWKYDVIQRSWTFLFDDNSSGGKIPSRVGHTMLLDAPRRGTFAGKRVLWVLAGQRGTTYLADMWTYQLSSGSVQLVNSDYSLGGGPEGGFTQRATMDISAREIALFSGLARRSRGSGERVRSAFWIYSIERDEWRLVYQHGGTGMQQARGESGSDDGGHEFNRDEGEMTVDPDEPPAFPTTLEEEPIGLLSERTGAISAGFKPNQMEPRPRFAAQMVYDWRTKLFYIFGGNPAEGSEPSVRLGDLWHLELLRPTLVEVLRKAKFRLRQQRFLEMAHEQSRSESSAIHALVYLQSHVSEVVDHSIPEESQTFRKLMSHLLQGPPQASPNPDSAQEGSGFDSPLWPGARSTFSPLPPSAEEPSSDAVESSGSEHDSEMLSVSQVIGPRQSSTMEEGRPSALYKQRYHLFRALCEFLPQDATEPEMDLLDCVEASSLLF